MGEQTAIGWCDDTYNPWWGCERVSPGCQMCYAEALAKRFGTGWGKNAERRFFGDKHWAEPLKWNREAESWPRRRRVFCASMADVFEDRDDLIPHRDRLFELIGNTPNLDWLLLTKRPENVLSMAPARWLDPHAYYGTDGWPVHAWIGTTVEDQQRAEERIPHLLSVPAKVRFLSCEPLLAAVDLGLADDHRGHDSDTDWSGWGRVCVDCSTEDKDVPWVYPSEPRIHWVIVGGESGARARRMDPDWARSIVNQCAAGQVPVWFKQAGKVLGREWGCPDSHGEDWSSWPEWARVREHPAHHDIGTWPEDLQVREMPR